MSEHTASGSSGADFDLTQFYQVFFEEAAENLANMETQLLDLDVGAPDDEELNAIFRCAHSIKGGAATFGFQDVADLTHVMETLLDRLRRHELNLTSAMVDVLLESGDALTALLDRYRGATDEVLDASHLVARIRAFADGAAGAAVADTPPAATAPAATAPAPAAQAKPSAAPAATPARGAMPAAKPPAAERSLDITVGPLEQPAVADELADLFAEIPGLGRLELADGGQPDAQGRRRFVVHTTSSDDDLLDLFTFHVSRELVVIKPRAAAEADEGFGFFVDLETLPKGRADDAWALEVANANGHVLTAGAERGANPSASADAEMAHAERAGQGAAPTPAGAVTTVRPERAEKPDKAAGVETSTLRVSVEKVDQLINLVGELVITQAMLAQNGSQLDPIAHQQLMGNLVDLERNTRLLQEAVMAIRMIPMAVVFNRFPRMLRDLAAKLGKQVELHTVGEATELDKGMIEKITDPLTHLVRNSLDHGIEAPAVRQAQGKPTAGTITLSAQHKGGSIAIEVRDDGKGLAREKILSKAREKGMDVHDGMTDHEVFQLIFEPGFSTADQVTEVSGRGVGMDVVRRNILGLGGSVDLDSAEGYGTRVTVRLPLTLAIMDGMSVAVGDEIYILPLASVIESIRLDSEHIRSVAGANRVIEVRKEFLPVVDLDEMFSVPRFDDRVRNAIMIVVEAEGARVALLVDELVGQHQVVVKNLEANYRKVPGVSGATILGDGRVALILDVGHMVRRARH